MWPLLVVRFSGTPNTQQVEEYLARRGSNLARKQQHALIYDTVRFNIPTPGQHQRQIDWLQEHKELLRQFSLGSALIITSPVQAATPYHAARSLPDAADWCAGRLAEAGLLVEAQRVRAHFGLTPHRSAG